MTKLQAELKKGEAREDLLPHIEPEVPAHVEVTRSDAENHSSDQLTRLFQNTAQTLRNELKRPPTSLSQIN